MRQTASLYDFTIKWEPFLLRPGIPENGVEKPPQYKTVSKTGHLYQSGAAVGIDFTAKCSRAPNTIKAHAMLEFAANMDVTGSIQHETAEHIFQAYFTDGRYPDMELFTEIGQKMGFDEQKLSEFMNDPENTQHAEQAAMSWREKVQTGIPYFIINGMGCFSGAQEPETFVKTFSVIAQKNPVAAK